MKRNAIRKSKQVSSMSGPNRNKKSETRVSILNENHFWKIQVNRIMISIKEPNKRQIGKLENRNRFQACQDQIDIINLKQGYLILKEYPFIYYNIFILLLCILLCCVRVIFCRYLKKKV